MTKKIWKVLPKVSDDLKTQLLYNRGLKTKKEIDEFLNPSLINYSKEIAIPGIEKAWKRIQKAIDSQGLIVVYGDYDVDGICASAILYKGLSSLGAKVLPYIPHREKEGYGLSKTGLEFARDSGAAVVVTVDNGIVALEQAKFAKEIGLDLIITDHHLPLETLPEAFTIVHSTKMCGAAVAWCLIREKIKDDLAKELLELVGIATVADMLPLTGLGRVFVTLGLKVLNRTKNLGLQSLINEAGLNLGSITSYEIGHVIGPRLNAIGRLEHAIDALRLICTKDPSKARKLAQLLCETNTQRQFLTSKAIEEAKLKIDITKKIHIIESNEWVPGIIGLIAARICEEHNRPAIAISIQNGVAKGSARSIKGINIVEVIRESSDPLIDVGGHSGAAGFSLLPENIALFREKLEKVMGEIEISLEEQELEIEAEIPVNKLSKKLASELDEFEPFGYMNPKPVFLSKNLRVEEVRLLKEGKHIKLKVSPSVISSDPPAGGERAIDTIGFGLGEWGNVLKIGSTVDIVYYLEINRFNGSENLQLKVKDIRMSE